MKRRQFLMAFSGIASIAGAFGPCPARAQQRQRIVRFGVLLPYGAGDPEGQARINALRNGLNAVGWTEASNIRIDVFWTPGDAGRLQAAARELVASAPDAILVNSNVALTALQHATTVVPIVFVGVSDPVGEGFVKSLSHPGGNITGFTNFETEIGSKWVQTLKELVPGTGRILVLRHPTIAANAAITDSIAAAGAALGLTTIPARVGNPDEIRQAITGFGSSQNGALIALPNPVNIAQRKLIIGLAAEGRLPAIYPYRLFVTDGGFASYGIDQVDMFRRAASYVDRILKGTRPADLPVQQPTKYALALNLQTAKKLGLEIAPTLLARADEVIE